MALRYAEHIASRWYSRTEAEEILEHPVDMQDGLAAAVAPFLAGKGWTGDPHRFVTWWRRTHFEDSMIDSL